MRTVWVSTWGARRVAKERKEVDNDMIPFSTKIRFDNLLSLVDSYVFATLLGFNFKNKTVAKSFCWTFHALVGKSLNQPVAMSVTTVSVTSVTPALLDWQSLLTDWILQVIKSWFHDHFCTLWFPCLCPSCPAFLGWIAVTGRGSGYFFLINTQLLNAPPCLLLSTTLYLRRSVGASVISNQMQGVVGFLWKGIVQRRQLQTIYIHMQIQFYKHLGKCENQKTTLIFQISMCCFDLRLFRELHNLVVIECELCLAAE